MQHFKGLALAPQFLTCSFGYFSEKERPQGDMELTRYDAKHVSKAVAADLSRRFGQIPPDDSKFLPGDPRGLISSGYATANLAIYKGKIGVMTIVKTDFAPTLNSPYVSMGVSFLPEFVFAALCVEYHRELGLMKSHFTETEFFTFSHESNYQQRLCVGSFTPIGLPFDAVFHHPLGNENYIRNLDDSLNSTFN